MGDLNLERDVLKGVSRSFYLSLRILPAPMRRPAGIAYLLARTSDTIADSVEIPGSERLECLDGFAKRVIDGQFSGKWPERLLVGTPDPREKLLLEKTGEVLGAFEQLPESEAALIREVVGVIIGGQKLDIERFGTASGENFVCLSSAAELEDYAWRVAGCVGVFWTKLGYETLGERFSSQSATELLKHARDYGSGLQLVNILRDLSADLAAGRCYLPVLDPADHTNLMQEFCKWRKIAENRMFEGTAYAAKLATARLRVASELPALIGLETLAKLRNVSFDELSRGVKIPRRSVYRLLAEVVLKNCG